MIPRLLGRAVARLQRPRTLRILGGGALALALGVAFLPRLFPAAVFRPLSALVASPAAILLFGAAAGLLGVQAVRASATGAVDDADRADRWTPTRPPERAYYDEYRTAGDDVDAVFDVAPDEADNFASGRRKAHKRILQTAISVVADVEGVDRDTAADLVGSGAWTDDPRAAAFLGRRNYAPLRIRIRDWASGEHFERWADRAVAEIEALDRDDVSDRERIDARDRSPVTETDEEPVVEDPADVPGPGINDSPVEKSEPAEAATAGETGESVGSAETDESGEAAESAAVTADGEATDAEQEVAGR
ncbi:MULTISPECIES: hypothetical protein [Halorussus]|uniref:DUF7269 family protein n=1 Tax=Halorussus TaxID=1070314 RepID=UPI000E20F331|nr:MULTISPECIES: hypothetical protein [Halorussus]NHN61517.1 hypothetical protein [Halorussus sp. JP-T4]